MALVGAVNPDFGQVEVDPAVVNLTAFETFFEEKRPFFTEGSQVFLRFGRSGASDYTTYFYPEPQLFYSRRIGRAPQGRRPASSWTRPPSTTILGAAKLVGRTKSGWSVGLLEAVTGREYARVATGAVRDRGRGRAAHELLRRPRAARPGAARVDRLPRHRRRPRPRHARPRGLLVDRAFVGGVDGHVFLDGKRDWVVSGGLSGSTVAGSQASVLRVQRAAPRYYQRPDAPHVSVDPHGDVALRLERAARPQQEQRQRHLQRGPVGDQPRLRAERPRLRDPDRPGRRPRPGPLPQADARTGGPAPGGSRSPSGGPSTTARESQGDGVALPSGGAAPELLAARPRRSASPGTPGTTSSPAAGRPRSAPASRA